MKRVSAAVRERILNPEPGSALARAREYGMDLTLILAGIERTPQERLQKVVQAQALARTIVKLRENLRHE